MDRPVLDPSLDLANADGPLAIICGGGSLPFAIADSVQRRGRKVVLFAVRGWADPQRVAAYPNHWAALGSFGRFCRVARAEGCRDVVFIGVVLRPKLTQIRVDFGTLKVFPQIIAAFRGGDDHLLSSLARIFEREGFRLRGAHEVAPEILVGEGALGRYAPSARDQSDITRGLALIEAAGSFDVGQAAVVADGHVLAIEAAEGTDQMLQRVAELRRTARVQPLAALGVLVKAPKPHQDRRFDLPTIGPQTVIGAAQAGLAGVAVLAGETIVAEPQAVAAVADREKIFVFGLPAKGVRR
jgi:UDP-2,3-diacylglucosamine hydrolase